MFTRFQIYLFVGAIAFTWFLVLLVQGTPVEWDHARPFSLSVGAGLGIGWLANKYLWRAPLLRGFVFNTPDLNGCWQAELRSNWTDPETNSVKPPIVAYVTITQTLTSLQMLLMTEESQSSLIGQHIRPKDNDIGFEFIGVYRNDPRLHLQEERSRSHRGSFVLETHGPKMRPDHLTGSYWTDRRTNGEMVLSSRVREFPTSYHDAAKVHQ